jgi:carboxylate-amine ligase
MANASQETTSSDSAPSARVQDPQDHCFGASSALSIGVEEELLLVDVDDGYRLKAESERILEAIGAEGRKRVTTEIFATQIELKTGICSDADQAATELAQLRRMVREHGGEILGAGIHPDDDEEAALVRKPRYDVVKEDLASLLRTPPCGLHVHVGMPDPETAIRVGNTLRQHLPLLQALTVNSPFRQGEDSGLASARAAVVATYPRFEMPRAFRDYEEFCSVADELIAAAGVEDYTYLWWDVRPHPRLGTVEVRAMDVQTEVEKNAAVAVLVQALAAMEIDRPLGEGLHREALEEAYYQAGRHGLQAQLLTADGGTTEAGALARRVLGEVRPYARELGSEDALETIERIVREGNGADQQRRLHAERGMGGLLADLVARTVPA